MARRLRSSPWPESSRPSRRPTPWRSGLHVLLFSDNVSVDDERDLKEAAVRRRRLLMGPGAGTAILDGVALGFANKVRRGPIGVVAGSGTGLQEVTVLVHRGGSGISQAIGTGGRDLKIAIGGLMTRLGLELLAEDPETKVIVLLSKPPERAVADQVLGYARSIGKPVDRGVPGRRADDRDRATTSRSRRPSRRLRCGRCRRSTGGPPIRSRHLPAHSRRPRRRRARGLLRAPASSAGSTRAAASATSPS